jgi:hypothetical protein
MGAILAELAGPVQPANGANCAIGWRFGEQLGLTRARLRAYGECTAARRMMSNAK